MTLKRLKELAYRKQIRKLKKERIAEIQKMKMGTTEKQGTAENVNNVTNVTHPTTPHLTTKSQTIKGIYKHSQS